jgi:hypothetical protein
VATPVTSTVTAGPALLRALDDVTAQNGGWLAECPICRDALEVVRATDHWHLECAGECSHDELVDWLQCDIYDQHPSGEGSRRMWRAVMLAPTTFVCVALLNGEKVPVSALDATWVRRFGIR